MGQYSDIESKYAEYKSEIAHQRHLVENSVEEAHLCLREALAKCNSYLDDPGRRLATERSRLGRVGKIETKIKGIKTTQSKTLLI